MIRSTFFISLILILGPGWQPLAAQEEAAEATQASDTRAILQALELPRAAEILRERGVPIEEIRAAIEGARKRAVSPGEMTDVFRGAAESVEESGPIENFGAFVQEHLAAGLRGQALAEAIRAEHARRGIGQGRMLEPRSGPPDSMRGGPPGNRKGGPPDTTRRGKGGGDGDTRGQGNGGQR